MSQSKDPKDSKARKKYRPYLSYPELFSISQSLQNTNNSPAFLLMSLPDRKASMDAEYVITSLIRDIEYEKKAPALVSSGRILNSQVTGADMFDDNEIVDSVPLIKSKNHLSDHEILENASEYEQDLIFLNEELRMEFISKELFQEKLIALKTKHGITP